MDWTIDDTAVEQTPAEVPGVLPTPRTRPLVVLLALVLVLAVASFGFVLGHFVVKSPSARAVNPVFSNSNLPPRGVGDDPSFGANPSGGFTISPNTSPSTSSSASANRIAQKVDPGVVDITTNLSYQNSTAAGTGMVLTSNGLVLTNNHVIEGATSISARDVSTGATYKVTVLGYSVSKDVALLQLQHASGLSTVKIAGPTALVKGQTVVGIGNAGGAGGRPSAAPGTVVALNQSLSASDPASATGVENLSGMIEVNANVQPGDSGGPLVNKYGKVIGMDTAGGNSGSSFAFDQTGLTTSQAYAIPIGTALAIATSIEQGHSSSSIHIGPTSFLGLELSSASSGNPDRFGFGNQSPTVSSGLIIEGIIPGTPAASSSLASGDTITALNGQKVSTTQDLQRLLATMRPGDKVQIGYSSPTGSSSTATLQLTSGPPQ